MSLDQSVKDLSGLHRQRCIRFGSVIRRRKNIGEIDLLERSSVVIGGSMKRGKRSVGGRRKASSEAEQLPLWKVRGGKRKGAGRKPKGERAGSPHKERPELTARYPVHVVLRVVDEVRGLRRRRTYQAIRQATLTTARREDFRIVHLSIQRTHLHLIVEADDKAALASGMQGFQISAAKHLNAAISKGKPGRRRRGPVFPDRYHAEIITSPRQARHTLSYVVNNWRKHQEDRVEPMSSWTIDWFSSAVTFPAWAEYGEQPAPWRGPETYEPLVVHPPTTWLLREGYKRGGPPISCREIPSAHN
jgi:REP element-mobilizing transposase RayT